MKTHPKVIRIMDWTAMERRRRTKRAQGVVAAVCLGVVAAAAVVRVLIWAVTSY